MCTFLVVDSAGEYPCHVLAHLAESSPLQPPLAGGPLLRGSQEH